MTLSGAENQTSTDTNTSMPITELLQPIVEEPTRVIAPLVALVVAYALFYEGLIHKVDDWAWLRQWLPYVDDEAREQGFYTSYTVQPEEYVGTLRMTRDEAVSLFEDLGFLDAPLAAHKENWEGQREVASLGWYGRYGDEILAKHKAARFILMAFVIRKQLHVTLFEDEDGYIVVTAHYEYSPYNVFYAFEHFIGENYNIEKGVAMTHEMLEDVEEYSH